MTDDIQTSDLKHAAADWFIRLQEDPGSELLREQIADWLQGGADRQMAWQQICQTWQILGDARPRDIPAPATTPRPAPGSRRPAARPPVRRAWAAAAVVAAVLAMAVLPDAILRIRADHLTGTAETRLVTLKDGSRVFLSADSAISADLSTDLRAITLLAGRAFFEVTPDASRPFVVTAGDMRVTVLGTAFDIRRTGTGAAVELAHGSVGVTASGPGGPVEARLMPNEALSFDRRDDSLTRHAIAPQDIGAWRDGRLSVRDAPLGAVVEDLRRYHGGWITIASPDLANRHVTGVFDLDTPESALAALVRPFGGKVRKISNYFIILSYY